MLAPVIEPAGPVLAGHEGAVGTQFLERGEAALRVAGTEVDDGGQFGKRAVGDLLGTVGGVEQSVGRGEAGFEQRGLHGLHVRVVVAEGAVFVFDLDGDDGAAILDQQRRDFLRQPREPRVHGGDVFGVGGAKDEDAVLEQPRGIAAEVPLRADVGPGAEDDVEALLLGFADVLGHVVLAGEVVDAGARFVEVPEDVCGDGVQAHGAGLAETVAPVGTRHAG